MYKANAALARRAGLEGVSRAVDLVTAVVLGTRVQRNLELKICPLISHHTPASSRPSDSMIFTRESMLVGNTTRLDLAVVLSDETCRALDTTSC